GGRHHSPGGPSPPGRPPASALDAEQKKYAVGKSTTFTVLQLQNNLTTARSQEIRALADYNKALASLAAEEGSTLDRNGIKLETK
ncbi:MAG: TolC family protein, partial [Verrucomicrobiota bacterium]